MPTYKAPVADVMFLLGDVFHIDYGPLGSIACRFAAPGDSR